MTRRRILGSAAVIIGFLFLLSALGVGFSAWYIIGIYWPILIILVGLINLFGTSGIRLPGIVIIVIGCFLLIETTGYTLLGLSAWEILLPLLIILVGVWLLFPKAKNEIVSRHFIKQVAIFSEASIQCDSNEFKGGDLFTMFGGIDVDLRAVVVGDDRPAKIEVLAAFGGVEIIVPEDYKVLVTGIPIFGGWSNRTNKVTKTGEADLLINALIMFGGMEVKTTPKR